MPGRLLLIAIVLLLTGHAPALAQSDELRDLRKKAREFAFSRPAEALAAAERALQMAEASLGPEHVEVGEILADLARLHVLKDRFADAEPLEDRAVAIMEKALGADNRAFADFLGRIAGAHTHRRFARAGPLYKRALAIYEKTSANDPQWPYALFNIADMYEGAHRYAEALPLFERALAEAKKRLGADNSWTLMVLERLHDTYLTRGRYVESEQSLRRLLVALGRLRGSEQDDPATSYHLRRLARLYVQQGHYADAERLYRRAHRTEQKAGAPPAPAAVAHHERELASLYHAQGRYAEAERIYARELRRLEEASAGGDAKAEIAAIEDKLRAMGKGNTFQDMDARRRLQQDLTGLWARSPRKAHMANVLGSLGATRWRQGKHADAEAMFDRALALLGESDDAAAMSVMLDLARLYTEQARFPDAEQLFTRVLHLDEEDWREQGRPPGAMSAGILNDLARLARKRNRLERAERLHKAALKILEDLGPDRIDVAATLVDLADLYRSQGRYAEAEPLYQRALRICETGDLSPNHELVRSALANLVALYAAQGRDADADRLRRGGPHAEFWVR